MDTLQDKIAAAIDALPPSEAEALQWHLAGFSMTLLAKAKNVTRSSTATALKRAQSRLAQAVGAQNVPGSHALGRLRP
jgi:DNA-directed RNA polymerase specialized sigma24 family protein